ncbi:1-deoxy-D-xylulose 5-phosphate reductoisomerase, partial [Chlamydia psittaci 03DC29]
MLRLLFETFSYFWIHGKCRTAGFSNHSLASSFVQCGCSCFIR